MSAQFKLRPMMPDDSPALADLTAQSPDGGRIAFSPRFHVRPYDVFKARHGDMEAVVVEAPDATGLVGAAHVSFGECQYEGAIRPYALFSALIVHPDYRRQGMASALAQWCIERADERHNKDGIFLADIQTGNAGSFASAQRWANQIAGTVLTNPVPMRNKPPQPVAGISVREATSDDLLQIVDQMNAFYADYNFYRPQTVDSLHQWLQETPLDTPINHYLVAVNQAGQIVSGMSIQEDGRLMSLFIEKVPAVIRLANLFLKVVPADGEMRNLQANNIWFAPHQLEAARYLWQTIRWEWRAKGSSLLCNIDPRSPVKQVIQNPAWMPTTSSSIAVRAPVPMNEDHLLQPIL